MSGKKNAGVECASAAALAVSGAWMVPRFAEDRAGRKLTDFNDLAVLEGLMPVRAQVEARIVELGWSAGGRARAAPDTGEGGRRPMAPIESVDELLERFALVYGHRSTVFDFRERILMALTDMRDACTHRELHRRWMESPAKKLVRLREVGFDPAGTDSEITCNLWGGWPTVARSGSCEVLLGLLRPIPPKPCGWAAAWAWAGAMNKSSRFIWIFLKRNSAGLCHGWPPCPAPASPAGKRRPVWYPGSQKAPAGTARPQAS